MCAPRPRSAVALVLLLLALGSPLAGCRKVSDEQKILALLDAGETAAEAGKIGSLTDLLTDDFADADGNDKSAVKGVLSAQVLRGGKIVVVRRNEKISVSGETATAEFDAFLAGGDRGAIAGAVPSEGTAYRFSLGLRKVDGDWKIASGAWKHIDAAGFLLKK